MKLPSKNVKTHDNLRFHNSVPVISVLSKPPQLPYGAKYLFLGVLQVHRCSSEPEGVPPPHDASIMMHHS